MDASELSERIANLVREGMWSEAAAEVARAWKELSAFGTRRCDLPEFPDVFVRFHTIGYPFRLRRQWTDEDRADGLLEIILPHVAEWNLADLSGKPVSLSDGARHATLMDDVDTALVLWLVRQFSQFLLVDLASPRPNS